MFRNASLHLCGDIHFALLVRGGDKFGVLAFCNLGSEVSWSSGHLVTRDGVLNFL
jgi:hypothetical protein